MTGFLLGKASLEACGESSGVRGGWCQAAPSESLSLSLDSEGRSDSVCRNILTAAGTRWAGTLTQRCSLQRYLQQKSPKRPPVGDCFALVTPMATG